MDQPVVPPPQAYQSQAMPNSMGRVAPPAQHQLQPSPDMRSNRRLDPRPDDYHRRQPSYDRNPYASSSEGQTDSMERKQSSNNYEQIPRYSSPAQPQSREEPPASRSHTAPFYNNNNNDLGKRGSYSGGGGMNGDARRLDTTPAKPPRENRDGQHFATQEDDALTVSAKYSCAYCSKELGG